MPMFAKKSIEQLFHLKKPDFEVTGKVARQPQVINGHAFTVYTGIFVLAVAIALPSPALIPAAGVSVMFMLAPLLASRNRAVLSACSRGIPGLFRMPPSRQCSWRIPSKSRYLKV